MHMTTETAGLRHRFVETNGIRMHIAEQGEGPLVILCHGFPESWYSWRHQLEALAEAGYHALAPDQRGYGQTDRPQQIAQYTQLHLVGDIIGLMDALGEQQAVIAGHDWGAPVAWNSALLRPDRIRGVIGLSVPYTPRGPMSVTTVFREAIGERFYFLHFQEPGVAEKGLEENVRSSMRRILYSASGDAPQGEGIIGLVPEGGSFVSNSIDPETLPGWLTEADIDFYTKEFERTGFTGGLNWYRATDLTWELMAPFAGEPLTSPALYVAGDRDGVVSFPGMQELIPNLKMFVPNLRQTIMLPGCGHWTQQERPHEVNQAMIEFIRGL
jgi:pimeloyl-ACP methyl ester carboxylesterase